VLSAAAAAAQPGQFASWKETAKPRPPATPCSALRSLTGYDVSIESAVLVPAQGDTPEFCQVRGLIQPEVRFEVALPTAWNGRLYMFGNGGFAGESLAAGGRVNVRNTAVRRGFATAQTNTGHDAAREPLATFATTPQKVLDYAFRAVHVTAVTAKSIIQTYFGSPASRAYFVGCSTGGRQGLIAAQRFPDDFDGIVVGAPVLDFTGVMTHAAVMHRALTAAPVTAEQVQLVAERVFATCDAVDGFQDGLVEDPRRCRFDVERDVPVCGVGGADSGCLPEPQAKAFQAVYADVMSGGALVFPGFPVGGEALVQTQGGRQTGWAPWIVSDKGPTISLAFAESFFKEMVSPGAPLDWREFDPARDMEKLARIGTLLNATDPDLSRFRARGGRILMYYGWADPALNPLMGVNYYERMRQAMGGNADDFFRLFMMPGVLHCAGGNGPSEFDSITALVEWVERGTAPDRLIATQRVDGKPVRTRPLCVYPKVARHDGKGRPDDAASFTCGEVAASGGAGARQDR